MTLSIDGFKALPKASFEKEITFIADESIDLGLSLLL